MEREDGLWQRSMMSYMERSQSANARFQAEQSRSITANLPRLVRYE